jgi:hypothetical protein
MHSLKIIRRRRFGLLPFLHPLNRKRRTRRRAEEDCLADLALLRESDGRTITRRKVRRIKSIVFPVCLDSSSSNKTNSMHISLTAVKGEERPLKGLNISNQTTNPARTEPLPSEMEMRIPTPVLIPVWG